MEFNRVTSYMRASMYEIIFSNETIKMFSFLSLFLYSGVKVERTQVGKPPSLRRGSIFAIDRGLILFYLLTDH